MKLSPITLFIFSFALSGSAAFQCSDITEQDLCLPSISCNWSGSNCIGTINIPCSGTCYYVFQDSQETGDGSLQKPWDSLNTALGNISLSGMSSAIILISSNHNDSFSISQSYSILATIMFTPFVETLRAVIQVNNSAQLASLYYSNASPNITKFHFTNITLQAENAALPRNQSLFNLQATGLILENCLIQKIVSNQEAMIQASFSNFKLINSTIQDYTGFFMEDSTSTSFPPKVYITFQDSLIQNTTGKQLFKGTGVTQLQIYNLTVKNVRQDISQNSLIGWIRLEEAASVDINGFEISDSKLLLLQFISLPTAFIRPNITNLAAKNVDLTDHKTLFHASQSFEIDLINIKWTNISNARSIVILDTVGLFPIKSLETSNVTTVQGHYESLGDIKMIASLISCYNSHVTIDSFQASEISSPAIYSHYSSFTLSNGSIINNQLETTLNSEKYSSLLISEQGDFSLNKTYISGFTAINGAVLSLLGYPLTSKTSQLIDSTFQNNIAMNFGGVIYNENILSMLDIQNCSFINNSAVSGGAIYINSQQFNSEDSVSSSSYPLEIRSSYFEKNRASSKGGSIFSKDFIFISQSTFKENTAISGGAFYRSFPAQKNLTGTQDVIESSFFEQNMAHNQGGGFLILSKKSQSLIFNNTFSQNYAEIYNDYFIGLPTNIQFNAYSSLETTTARLLQNQIDAYKSSNLFSSSDISQISNYLIQLSSGSSFPQILELLVLDEDNNIYEGVNGDVIELSLQEGGNEEMNNFKTLRGQTSLSFNRGSILIYNQVELFGQLQENATFKLALNQDSSPTLQETDFDVDVQLMVSFLKCNPGEIFDKDLQICKLCKPGTYTLTDPAKTHKCKTCPFDKAICPGGNKLAVKPGYWRKDSLSDNILECPDGVSSCLGSLYQNNYIAPGKCDTLRTGGLCDECIKGYLKIENPSSCIDCKKDFLYYIRYFILLLLQVLFIAYCIYLSVKKNSHILVDPNLKNSNEGANAKLSTRAMLLKVHLNFLQALNLLTRFKMKWPRKFNIFPIIISETVPSDENALISRCILKLLLGDDFSYHFAQLFFVSLIPILFWLSYVFLTWLANLVKGHKLAFTGKNRKDIAKSFMTIGFIFQPTILQTTLRSFDCVSLPDLDDSNTYISQDHSIQCGSKKFYLFTFCLVLPSLLFWGVILPILLLKKLHTGQKNRKRISAAFLFISNGKGRKFCWDYILYFGKLLLIIVFIFLQSVSLRIQILLAFTIMLILLYLQIKYKPYRDPKLNKLEIISFLILIFYTYSGLFFLNNMDSSSYDTAFLVGFVLLFLIYLAHFITFMVKPLEHRIYLPPKVSLPQLQKETLGSKESPRSPPTPQTADSLRTSCELPEIKPKKLLSLKSCAFEKELQSIALDTIQEEVFIYKDSLSSNIASRINFLKEVNLRKDDTTPS